MVLLIVYDKRKAGLEKQPSWKSIDFALEEEERAPSQFTLSGGSQIWWLVLYLANSAIHFKRKDYHRRLGISPEPKPFCPS